MLKNATVELKLKVLEPEDKNIIRQISLIHKSELTGSLIPKLGLRFSDDFYYRELTKDKLIKTLYALYDNKVIGFLSFTTKSEKFMNEGLKKHFFLLIWLMLISLLENPKIIKQILNTLKIMASEKNMPGNSINTELLSIAVLPEYRNKTFIEKIGESAGTMLFNAFIEELKKLNISEYKVFTDPVLDWTGDRFYRRIGLKALGETNLRGYNARIFTGTVQL